MSGGDLLLRDVRPMGGAACDLVIRAGRIAAAGAEDAALPVFDGGGALVIPGLVDGHIHLDKTLLGLPWRPHAAGPSVRDRIENERHVRGTLPLSVAARAGNLIRQAAAYGTVALRTHVDIDTDVGTGGLDGVLAALAAHRHLVDAEIVAFPQGGIVGRPGVVELMDAALRSGAGVVGGVDPAGIDGDAAGQIGAIFALAERHGAKIDIHLHDAGELGLWQIGLICARTQAAGLGGRVAISHAFALGTGDDPAFGRAAAALATAGVAIMTHAPGAGQMPPVERLRDAGVTVFAGSDNIRDLWAPWGNGDMLERAFLIAYRQNLRSDAGLEGALALSTVNAARVMGLDPHGPAVGARADLVLLDGETLAEAIVTRRPRRAVIKAGRVVARDGRLS